VLEQFDLTIPAIVLAEPVNSRMVDQPEVGFEFGSRVRSINDLQHGWRVSARLQIPSLSYSATEACRGHTERPFFGESNPPGPLEVSAEEN
jgi:hypothetical protein